MDPRIVFKRCRGLLIKRLLEEQFNCEELKEIIGRPSPMKTAAISIGYTQEEFDFMLYEVYFMKKSNEYENKIKSANQTNK